MLYLIHPCCWACGQWYDAVLCRWTGCLKLTWDDNRSQNVCYDWHAKSTSFLVIFSNNLWWYVNCRLTFPGVAFRLLTLLKGILPVKNSLWHPLLSRGQLANSGFTWKMAVKSVYVCVSCRRCKVSVCLFRPSLLSSLTNACIYTNSYWRWGDYW